MPEKLTENFFFGVSVMCKYQTVHTFLNSPCPTGFSQAVPLQNWAAEADVHETLGLLRQGGSPAQHHPDPPSQYQGHLGEDVSVREK